MIKWTNLSTKQSRICRINNFKMKIIHSKMINVINNKFIKSLMIILKCFWINKEINYGWIIFLINKIHKDKRKQHNKSSR
jgi:hypothetical protein